MKIDDISKLTKEQVDDIRRNYGDEYADAIVAQYHLWLKEQRTADKKKYRRR